MAGLKASEIKYGQVTRVSVGNLWFTVTRIELPTGPEYEVGTLELSLSKLGLTDEAIAGAAPVAQEAGVGETASTTAPGAAIWCDPLMVKAKEEGEEAKEVAAGFLAQVTTVKGKPFLRLYGLTTAGDGKPINEAKTATKVVPGLISTTVYAFGK